MFSINETANITEEEHFGIINGMATIGVSYRDAVSLSGLWAPPFVSSDFAIETRFFGEKAPTAHYSWFPFEVKRSCSTNGLDISTTTTLLKGERAGIIEISVRNETDATRQIPVSISVSGTLDRVVAWEFARPTSQTKPEVSDHDGALVLKQGDCSIIIATDLEGATCDISSESWNAALPGGKTNTFHIAFSIGDAKNDPAHCLEFVRNSKQFMDDAKNDSDAKADGLFMKLPRLISDNKHFEKLYNRSLMHLITNQWNVPEFKLRPYYGTGSIKGGCVCNYLWNFGEIWEILPLYDPAACKEHIKQFLKTDLTQHFAFTPITGEAIGPWYPVNQEKIIGLIYYYVKNTGDMAFLDESVEGKSVFQFLIENAIFGDDLAKPVELIDYGPSNSHLELRRGYPYNHVMPDLNGRRYQNYIMAAELAEASGKSAPPLRNRADALKKLLKDRLWDSQSKWFRFLNEKGEPDQRLTVQMFKMFGSGVLDKEEETGLLSHLNETEFLSTQGLHSMSKTDIAYDKVDIDNGGGGICTSFTPRIAELFYKSDYAKEADDLFRRCLWWGERMPYWGDSVVADAIDYRKDTPLQCMVDGAAVAQGIIFGVFGVRAEFDGGVVFKPHVPEFAGKVSLNDLRLCGETFSIEANGDCYSVSTHGKTARAKMGEQLRWKPGEGF
jgi:hypothetical protein